MAKIIFLLSAAWLALSGTPLAAQMAVDLAPSIASPAPLGTVVTWTATVSGADPGTLNYRFRTRLSGTAFRTVVDYGPNSTLDWASIDQEGTYQVEVSVRNKATGQIVNNTATFELQSLVPGNAPVVTPTANPLVFIYSLPACSAGGRVRVQFQSANGIVNTPYKACTPGHSTNFYLAGLLGDSQYTAQHTIDTGTEFVPGPQVSFQTGDVPMQMPPVSVLGPSVPVVQGILLQSLFYQTVATDLNGNILWYYPGDITFLTRAQNGGTFLGLAEDGTKDPSQQFFREFDLAGITRAETNAARVNEQLAAMGMHSINAFHHEARKLPDGKYLVLAGQERILNDVQGPGAVNVAGDMILVLDPNLHVVWAWDAFDHLDPHRTAVLNETCKYPAALSCSPFYLSQTINDWLHGNSLQLTPDGNILFSMRHQDWIIKIDYENGVGTGNVLWRLGNGGDFQIQSSDPAPWFSHQHDANFERDNLTMSVFDDGNTRAANDPSAHSRGQVLHIDEQNRTATLSLNADLGTYSYALGSAQRLANGHYSFNSGAILDPAGTGQNVAQSVEVDNAGSVVYGIQFGTLEYRTFRMRDLYTEP